MLSPLRPPQRLARAVQPPSHHFPLSEHGLCELGFWKWTCKIDYWFPGEETGGPPSSQEGAAVTSRWFQPGKGALAEEIAADPEVLGHSRSPGAPEREKGWVPPSLSCATLGTLGNLAVLSCLRDKFIYCRPSLGCCL
ncbi:uncharacterized protein PIGC [Pan troglodytes]|uniref:uncharacterized protein PIGC n=1 Tax=Pan troglodytes TaxID=9598 RepID=UPI000511FB92